MRGKSLEVQARGASKPTTWSLSPWTFFAELSLPVLIILTEVHHAPFRVKGTMTFLGLPMLFIWKFVSIFAWSFEWLADYVLLFSFIQLCLHLSRECWAVNPDVMHKEMDLTENPPCTVVPPQTHLYCMAILLAYVQMCPKEHIARAQCLGQKKENQPSLEIHIFKLKKLIHRAPNQIHNQILCLHDCMQNI